MERMKCLQTSISLCCTQPIVAVYENFYHRRRQVIDGQIGQI